MIYSRWLRSLRYGNDYFKLINAKEYYETYQKYIETLLSRPNCILRIAALSDDHDVVLGWSLTENDILHYVHVQHDYRNKSIGKKLVPCEINTITHVTKTGLAIWNKHLKHAMFNPF
jgi:hypothetical protein